MYVLPVFSYPEILFDNGVFNSPVVFDPMDTLLCYQSSFVHLKLFVILLLSKSSDDYPLYFSHYFLRMFLEVESEVTRFRAYDLRSLGTYIAKLLSIKHVAISTCVNNMESTFLHTFDNIEGFLYFQLAPLVLAFFFLERKFHHVSQAGLELIM